MQVMTGEDDARDTRRFCETILHRHGKPVTLNGYCQGGYNALCTMLTGLLDGLVDAFITCVSPMDGTRSRGLARFLMRLPRRFNDLEYGTKILPNGNRVADGQLMGWIYKLKSIEQEIPAAVFFRDLMMFAQSRSGLLPINKTAAALNYWLQNDRSDLPMEITRISFLAYNTPIDSDGCLPVRLFGEKLELKRLKERKIPWLICYGVHDDLVEKETALAPLDFIDAEVTPFPKGHVAIATSWSAPNSACALHERFENGKYRGPVRFHMDLDAGFDQAGGETGKGRTGKPKVITE
jgi:pimeloyl-ACP methyl ester carboxylesterase